MEPGLLRSSIEQFCRRQNFSSEILYWPLFEGKMVTAGVMGIVPKFRYLLLTPALLSALDQEELGVAETLGAFFISNIIANLLNLLFYD